MHENQSITSSLKRIWAHLSLRRRWQLGFLLVLMLLASFAEILSIGAVLPFLGVLTAPEKLFKIDALQPLIRALGLGSPDHLLLILTVAFGIAALFAGFMRLTLLWASTRLSFAAGADMSIAIYNKTLHQPYIVHCARNSSEVINGISGKVNGVIYGVLVPTLIFISSSVMLVVILIALLSVSPIITLISFGGFSLIYFLIILLTRNRLLINSQINAHQSTQVIKYVQEGLGGIRDILIDNNQSIYCQIYRNADLPLRRAQGNTMFLSLSPRYGMEALGMTLIATLAFFLASGADGILVAIPVLGAMALAAQRLLPALQQLYSSWASIRSSHGSLQDVLELLDQTMPAYAHQVDIELLRFKENISLKQVSFRYDEETPYVLKNIDLTIRKGSKVGFIGATGSGKSTLIDVLMGLLCPTKGLLEIDSQSITFDNNRAWQSHIAHVPQVIFLADSSVEENIAFGVPKDQIDHGLVRKVAQQAQIAESIESWPDQYGTFVGERGVRLSGGQRQRIGIARALYKQADVIIFDEATSALDSDTEQAVMRSIEEHGDDLTLIIIAHRLTTLGICNEIYELKSGEIIRAGTYEEIITCSGNILSESGS